MDGGRAAAEIRDSPAITVDFHGRHTGRGRPGLPSKPWVAGSSPAGGVCLFVCLFPFPVLPVKRRLLFLRHVRLRRLRSDGHRYRATVWASRRSIVKDRDVPRLATFYGIVIWTYRPRSPTAALPSTARRERRADRARDAADSERVPARRRAVLCSSPDGPGGGCQAAPSSTDIVRTSPYIEGMPGAGASPGTRPSNPSGCRSQLLSLLVARTESRHADSVAIVVTRRRRADEKRLCETSQADARDWD
jgi:hypothetical protein